MNNEKINKLMAEKVMGWKEEFHFDKVPCYRVSDSEIEIKHVWTPTTDMNQAMECVEKMKENHYWYFSIDNDCGTDSIWRVEIDTYDHNGEGNFPYKETDKSLPLVICKAILKAKGLDKY